MYVAQKGALYCFHYHCECFEFYECDKAFTSYSEVIHVEIVKVGTAPIPLFHES